MEGTNVENIIMERLQILVDEVGGVKEFISEFDEAELTPDITIDEITFKKWLNGNTKLELYNAYLIANAFHVSMNWLLGLTGEKNKNTVFFKQPATYGDVLIFLGQLFETGTIKIGDTSHYAIDDNVYAYDDLIIDDNIYAYDGLIFPQYIVVTDKNLYKPIETLIKARSLNENDFIDSLEEMFESQMECPLQYCGNNDYHDKKHLRPSEDTDDDIAKKALSYDDLMEKIVEQLEKLRNGTSFQDFADKIGCPKSTVNDWFNKKSMPHIKHICLITNTLEKSSDWILGLDENENRDKFYKGERYTYGGISYILGHLIANGTIGIIGETDYDETVPYTNDIFRIDDGFLFCLLLRMETTKHNSDVASKRKLEQLFETYKDTPLLLYNTQNRNLRSDMHKLICNVKGNKRYRDIDLNRLYKSLQTLK